MTIDEFRRDEEWIRFLFFLDRIYRIDGIFFACSERPFGRRPLYPTILLILSNCFLKNWSLFRPAAALTPDT
jgi:hypothetical protein